MHDTTVSVPLPRVTIMVKMPGAYGLRLWIAARLFIIAGWIANADVEVEL